MKPDIPISSSDRAPKLLAQVVDAIRIRHYSIRTEQAYVHWVKAYIRFHGLRHPREMGAREVTKFLSHLATERDVAAATQQQALSALLFLYRHVLEIDLPWLDDLVRPKKPARTPVVLSRGELTVRHGKGGKDRPTVLPASAMPALRAHLARVRVLWERDEASERPGVQMPEALARKYPSAPKAWGCFWVFPARELSTDPRSGIERRHHTHEQALQRAIKAPLDAVRGCGV